MTASLCSRCQTPLAPEDLRCAVCSLPAPDGRAAPERVLAQILRCDECGAAVSYTVEARAPRCAFCRSVMHLEVPADPLEEAEGYLPFFASDEQARSALVAWLGSLGFFRPSDLQKAATIDQLQPLWWVGWIFDAEALVSWTADSDAGSRRSAWAPHAGQHPLTLRSILVSASRGLTRRECGTLAASFRLETAQPAPQGPPGATLERFDVQRSAARRTIVEAVEAASRQQATAWIPGSRYRNLHVAVLLRKLFTRRLAFPTYVLAYRYRDKLYRALVHGQDAALVVGDAPYSLYKIAGVVLSAVALIALVLLLVASR